MTSSKIMETRRRFQEVYGQRSEEKDYGSMENLANAHREYLKVVRRQNREAALRRIDQSMQYVEHLSRSFSAETFQQNVNVEVLQPAQPRVDSVQFEAASFLRRLLAELIDFVFILSFKLAVVGTLSELGHIDLKQIGASLDDDQDVMNFINLAQDLLPVEVVCKVFCCFVEAVLMARGFGPIGVGQTLGKWMCGIRVISCRDVTSAERPDQIIVEGPDLITYSQALKRSFIKNLVVSSFFPLSTAVFQINRGRVFYDMMVKTCVVVEIN